MLTHLQPLLQFFKRKNSTVQRPAKAPGKLSESAEFLVPESSSRQHTDKSQGSSVTTSFHGKEHGGHDDYKYYAIVSISCGLILP